MNTQAYEDMLFNTIKMRGDLPIPGLVNRLAAAGMETEGDWSLYFPGRPHTVLWSGLSEPAAETLSAFLGRKDIDPRPLSGMGALMVFGYEGLPMLDLPMAEKVHPSRDFTALHWLPLTIAVARRNTGQGRQERRRRIFKRVAFTRTDRITAWDKSQGHCWYCGTMMNPFDDFTIDHVHPVILGGTNDPANLVPCCASCNSEKRAMPLDQFRERRGGGAFWFDRQGGAS